MRITLSSKDIQELEADSKPLKGLYETFGKAMKMTREEFDMLAEAGERYVRAEIHKRIGGGAGVSKEVAKQIQQERERIKELLKSTRAAQEQDKALLDLIKTRRIANAQGGPAGDAADEANKQAIKNAKELLALEQTRLLRIKENTVAYVEQSKKVIEAENAVLRLEKKDSPFDLALSLEKNKKKLEELDRLLTSFDPNAPEIIIEPEVSLEPMKELDKELQKIRQDELELAVVTAQNVVEATKKGTQERLNAEQMLATEVAALEVFKIRISQDSEELKAEKIRLINQELKNEIADLDTKGEKDTQKTQDRIVDILQRANDLIERNEGDTFNKRIAKTKQMFEKMARDINEAMSQTKDTKLLEQLTKALKAVEEAGKEAVSAITAEEFGNVIGKFGDLYGEITKKQSILYENEQNNLKRMLDQKLISEEEYEAKSLALKKKQFEQEKQVAIAGALIDGAAAVVRALKNPLEVAFVVAMTAAQIAAIQSQQFPGFKEGVIDLQGPGTATSDSIPARLSRGESVMTAEETRRYKPVLQAIRDNEFEAFVAKRYTDAIRNQSPGDRDSSFAKNLSTSMELNSVEMIDAIRKNKSVKIANWDDFDKMMNKPRTAHKIHRRRAW